MIYLVLTLRGIALFSSLAGVMYGNYQLYQYNESQNVIHITYGLYAFAVWALGIGCNNYLKGVSVTTNDKE